MTPVSSPLDCVFGGAFTGGGGGASAGGTRIIWPASIRSPGAARLPSSRSWPVRAQRETWPKLTSGRLRRNQRSSRMPSSSASTAKVLERLHGGGKRSTGPDERGERDKLTGQERRVLDLIGEGLTNRQIAERMFLAEKTVKNYVSSLLAKLGMERRTQAAVFAVKHPPK